MRLNQAKELIFTKYGFGKNTLDYATVSRPSSQGLDVRKVYLLLLL